MNTRRAFLQTLAGLALAPVIAARALAAAKPTNPPMRVGVDRSNQPDTHCVWASRTIKVPSNRVPFQVYRNADGSITWGYLYKGDWDGTFKLEVCDNPAFVLADLMEAQGLAPDWAAIVHWGAHCDELVVDIETESLNASWTPLQHGAHIHENWTWQPRHTVNTLVRPKEPVHLRGTLRMHFLAWKSTDPRYRTSWPGIPYPGDVS